MGPGFAFMHPKGMIVWNEIVDFMRQLNRKYGYKEIRTPIILNEELWHRSGHWDHYKENMYFCEIDEVGYAVKPMNCPGGCLLYKTTKHSYRELPLRMAEFGMVHRHEASGVMHGLFRVRQFTQDDAHIYCMPAQIESEIIGVINLIFETYRAFGFEDFDDRAVDQAREAHRLRRDLGNRHQRPEGGPGAQEDHVPGSTRATGRSTAPRSTSTSRTASAGPGSSARSSSISRCRSGSS